MATYNEFAMLLAMLATQPGRRMVAPRRRPRFHTVHNKSREMARRQRQMARVLST